MRVRLAAQVLSDTVGNVLNEFGPPEAAGTAQFCLMMDKSFDCLNVSNRKEWQEKQKDFLKPYDSVDDVRFEWLDSFLLYFEQWKESSEAEMTAITLPMQDQICLYLGRPMKDFR